MNKPSPLNQAEVTKYPGHLVAQAYGNVIGDARRLATLEKFLGKGGENFKASSDTGSFLVKTITTHHYLDDVFVGDSVRTEGDASQYPLGIVLTSTEEREERRRRPRDPLALDLDGNGIQTTALTGSTVLFDHDANGTLERTGWISSTDGLLALDINNNDKIDNGTELFGDGTLLKNGQVAPDGYAALAEYDENNDLKVDSQDAIWASLKVWRDANGNGLTEAGELMTMTQAGVKSIDVGHLTLANENNNGNVIFKHGTYEKLAGGTGITGDVNFASTPSGLTDNTPDDAALQATSVLPPQPHASTKTNVCGLWASALAANDTNWRVAA